jgi:hypothetical protein
VQTFLPYADFVQSGMCLDYRRLGKQRVEAFQILNILTKQTEKKGWLHHPAVLMWQGYESSLAMYMDAMIQCWVVRGYKNTMKLSGVKSATPPPWLGDSSFHAAHRSNLLRKDESFYRRYSWVEPTNLPYIWPTGGLDGRHGEAEHPRAHRAAGRSHGQVRL